MCQLSDSDVGRATFKVDMLLMEDGGVPVEDGGAMTEEVPGMTRMGLSKMVNHDQSQGCV
jgi:hypothetical protein